MPLLCALKRSSPIAPCTAHVSFRVETFFAREDRTGSECAEPKEIEFQRENDGTAWRRRLKNEQRNRFTAHEDAVSHRRLNYYLTAVKKYARVTFSRRDSSK